MRISYSALETYKTCPLKFKLQVLDKIKTPKSIEAVFGTIIHSTLKRMFERTPLYPALDELLDIFNNQWSEAVKRLEEQDEEKFEAFKQEGLRIIKNYFKKNPPWNFNPVELESHFGVTITDKKTGEEHTLAGIIDRVDKNPETETYEIIDYKTAKRMPPQDIVDDNLQLSIYHLGLSKKWPHIKPENIKLSLYFLKHNEKISTERTLKDLEETKTKILKIINEIQELQDSGKEFIPTPSGLCDWCGYQKMCPMWKHLYSDEEPTALTKEEIEGLIEEHFELKNQNSQNNKRVKEIQSSICDFMDKEGVERVFGQSGYLTRSSQQRTTYKNVKMKKALEDLGKWDEETFVKKTQFTSIKASKKKGCEDENNETSEE